jgi:uncharacterized protein with ATP-grasp and redox domains
MQKAPPIVTSDKKSFAYFTVSVRFPDIITSLLENTDREADIKKKLEAILKSLPNAPLELLSKTSDVNKRLNAEIKKNSYRWDATTFLFAENYLYHLLYEIMDYKNNKLDYFAYKKYPDIIARKSSMIDTLKNIESILALPFKEALEAILRLNLMGNQADLSHMSDMRNKGMTLLIDHTGKAASFLEGKSRLDIILDNSGEELFFDLLLAHCVLKKTAVKKIKLHFKAFPYFVSDSMISDFKFLLGQLAADEGAKKFCAAIRDYVDSDALVLMEHAFWSDGDLYCNMPEDIKADLAASDLLVFKGDLNYRRLIEDRYWDWTTDTRKLVEYLHNNILIIRILKSEIQAGLNNAVVPSYENTEWMYNGKYGMIEFCPKPFSA